MIPQEWITLAASAVAVALMAGFAAVLGFRTRLKLDAMSMREAIAAYEPSRQIEDIIIDARGQTGLALFADGRLALVRSVADGAAVRVFAPGTARVRRIRDGVRIAFPDLGFPPATLRAVDADAVCAWLGAN